MAKSSRKPAAKRKTPARKLRVGVLFGGRSGEHEISLLSAASILREIDKEKYEVVPIGITKEGRWLMAAQAERLLQPEPSGPEGEKHLRAGDPGLTPGAAVLARGESVIVPPVPARGESISLVPFESNASAHDDSGMGVAVDVIFPVLHGTFGEDGTVQGLLELADIPYVGAGVLGSAAGMDKDVMKRLFAWAGLPIAEHLTVLRRDWEEKPDMVRRKIEAGLKYPVFVKPANLGSSVGISKVHNRRELPPALKEACSYDRKIVIEQGIGGRKRKAREIECSVLGNDRPEASIPGEIIPAKEFYDYQAKYLDEGSRLVIPAELSKKGLKTVQELAIRAFQAVECTGLARVDMLMDPKSENIYVNEINTMPGFTSISMFPRLWEASNLKFSRLIDRLIQLAIERHNDKKRNQYSR